MLSLQSITSTFVHLIWERDVQSYPRALRTAVRLVRVIYVLIRDLAAGELNLRAMSLVYTTLLSVVPLLAVSFSVLKGFDVHNQFEPLLETFLEPLGPKGEEVGARIIEFVENVKVGVLGSVGLAVLIYTVISLLQKIEEAFNYVWRIERLRSFSQRFSSYLTVILIGPVLMFTALGVTASVMNTSLVQTLVSIEPFGTLFLGATRLLPYILVCSVFAFLYVFIPNTRVRLLPALVGGVLAGFLWQSTGWIFASFIANSGKYAAIYSSFAILILLLIWLYVNWLILLLGAQLAFYVQNPQYILRASVRMHMSNRMREELSLQVMFLIADHHHRNRPAWTAQQLAQHLDLPGELTERLLAALHQQGYLLETNAEPPAYLPARDIATIRVADLIEGVRSAGENELVGCKWSRNAVIDNLMASMRGAVSGSLGERSLKDLVLDQRQVAP